MENSTDNLGLDNRSHLLSFLNEEISQIQKEDAKPGWTIWALIGGFATCCWLLINQIEVLLPNWNVVGYLLITFTLTCMLIRAVFRKILTEKSVQSEDRFVSVRKIFQNSVATSIISIIWFIILYYLTLELEINIDAIILKWTRYIFLAFIILIASTFLLFFASDTFVFPFGIEKREFKNKKLSITSSIFLFLLLTFQLYICSAWIYNIFELNISNIYEFKIAVLIFTLLILTLLFASIKSPSHTLKNLVELRRELVLGILPSQTIKVQVDLILRGMKIDDYYDKEVSAMLLALQNFEKETFIAKQKIILFNNKSAEGKLAIQEDLLTLDSLKDSINSHLLIAAKMMTEEVFKTKKKLTRKLIMIRVFNKDANSKKVRDILNAAECNMESYNVLIRRWFLILADVRSLDESQLMIIDLNLKCPNLNYNPRTGLVS